MSQATTEKNSKVTVITDSIAQVPTEVAQQLNIPIIPFTVNIGGKSYLDGIDLKPADLYRRMRIENILPTTTAASLGNYLESFRECLQAGASAILYVALSSKLSMGYNTACQAAEMVQKEFPDQPIGVFDSKQAATAEGFIAIAAAQAAASGKTLSEVQQVAQEVRRRVGLVATVETLEYLARGGRIGKASYMVGSLIKIKPILYVDEEGVVAPINRVRGENHALQGIVNQVVRQTKGTHIISLAVMEADAMDQAIHLKELALQKLQPTEVFFAEFTPVMGVHTGPGLVGLGYYFE